jgi:hypothetical protein
VLGLTVGKLFEKLVEFKSNNEALITSEYLDVEFPNNDYIKKLMIAYKEAKVVDRIEPFQNTTVYLWDPTPEVPAPLFDLIISFSKYTVMNQLTIGNGLSVGYKYFSITPGDSTTYPLGLYPSNYTTTVKNCGPGYYCPRRSSVQLGWYRNFFYIYI